MFLNHRQFFRCPIPTGASSEGKAELLVDGRRINGRVVEMSLGAFGVMVPESLPTPKDPLVRLKVRGLEYIVRVTREEQRRDGVLVALEKIEELVPNNTMVPTTPLGKWLTGATWAVALCIVAFALYGLIGAHSALSMTLNH
jgi:hypothetical protein